MTEGKKDIPPARIISEREREKTPPLSYRIDTTKRVPERTPADTPLSGEVKIAPNKTVVFGKTPGMVEALQEAAEVAAATAEIKETVDPTIILEGERINEIGPFKPAGPKTRVIVSAEDPEATARQTRIGMSMAERQSSEQSNGDAKTKKNIA